MKFFIENGNQSIRFVKTFPNMTNEQFAEIDDDLLYDFISGEGGL